MAAPRDCVRVTLRAGVDHFSSWRCGSVRGFAHVVLVGEVRQPPMPLLLCLPEKQLSDPTQHIHKVLETARILYGLIHARYVLTAQGLTDMVCHPLRQSSQREPSLSFGGKSASALCSDPVRLPAPRSTHVSCGDHLHSPTDAQKAKYKAHEFGSCPRTLCEKQTVLPTGLSDTASLRCAPFPPVSQGVVS